jgi:hypothetical protein
VITIPPLGIEPATFGDGFEQGGFAAAILADEEGHRAPEGVIDPMREGGDIERECRVVDLLRQARDSAEERRAGLSRQRLPLPPRLH